MSMEPVNCTKCGAMLRIDSNWESAVCPFCETLFISKYAIDAYQSRSNRVKAAETFMKLNDYASANRVFAQLSDDYPYDYRAWWGLIRVRTLNLTNLSISKAELDNLCNLLNNACTVAPEREGADITSQFQSYASAVKKNLNDLKNSAIMRKQRLDTETQNIQNDCMKKITMLTEKKRKFILWGILQL